MISQVYINGATTVDSDTFLENIDDFAYPSVSLDQYPIGGRSGVKLGVPFYKNHNFALEYLVKGDSFSEFVTNRRAFLAKFILQEDKDLNQLMTVKLDLSDSTSIQIDAGLKGITGGARADSPLVERFMVKFMSERPFWEGITSKGGDLNIYQGGGMSVPMPVPMDMSNIISAVQELELTNSGNAPAYPSVIINGPLSATWSLKNETTGKILSCSQTLATATDYVELDFWNRTAMYNGVTNILDKISGDWWWIKPGANTLKLLSSDTNQDAEATFTFKDSYLGV